MDPTEDILLGIYLVKSGSKGDSLLFRYPFTTDENDSIGAKKKKIIDNPYALVFDNLPKNSTSDDVHSGCNSRTAKSYASLCTELDPVATSSGTNNASLDPNLVTVVTLPDRVVSNLFAVKIDLCGRKLEIKINNVRFVGHPTQLSPQISQSATSSPLPNEKSAQNEPRSKDILAFNVVFALRAIASHEVVNAFHRCSQIIAQQLNKEEESKSYLSKESKCMLTLHDEASSPSEENNTSPYAIILQKSQLARELKKIFQDLHTYGKTHLKINESFDLNLCIPQIVHRLSLRYHRPRPAVGIRELQACVTSLHAFHGVLLLYDLKILLQSLPENESEIRKVVVAARPTMTLAKIAETTGMEIKKIYKIVVHLVFWAKATIIYPLSETNVYVIHPMAPTSVNCALVKKFSQSFPGNNLLKFLSQFSLGTSIGQLTNPLYSQPQKMDLFEKVVWLLRHRLICQLHTYVYLPPPNSSSRNGSKRLSPSFSEDAENKSIAGNSMSLNSFENSSNLSLNQDARLSNNLANNYNYQESSINSSRVSLSYERLMSVLRELGYEDFERESIYQIPAAKNPQDLNLFAKLSQYFDGKHHIEHIMYKEKIKRSQILAIIDKFRDVLITCQHEDKTVFLLCPYLCD